MNFKGSAINKQKYHKFQQKDEPDSKGLLLLKVKYLLNNMLLLTFLETLAARYPNVQLYFWTSFVRENFPECLSNIITGLQKLMGILNTNTVIQIAYVHIFLANRDLFPIQSTSNFRQFLIQATVSGFLHDIGKIKIPRNVINKPGKLNNLEYVIVQSHTAYSTGLLFEADLSMDSLKAILYHHENEDGSGYPCGYRSEQIPIMAKICHIVDVFDALTSKRAYKEPKTPYQALSIMADKNPYLKAGLVLA